MQALGVGEGAEGGPVVLGGRAELGEDLGELVDFVLALEEWVFGLQFAEDAAQAPDVDFEAVAFGAEEQFGGAVPECDDELGEFGGWGGGVAGHAEVG